MISTRSRSVLGTWLAVAFLATTPVLAQQPQPAAGTPASPAPQPAEQPATPGPATTATGAPAPPPAPAGQPQQMDGATYSVKLRDLQNKIDTLKEQIRHSHTKLSLLSDSILTGGGSGARAVIKFENKLSEQFKLTRLLVVLDGAVQYNKQDRSGALDEQKTLPIFNGSIPPGDHTVQVLVNLRGHGYGVFSYVRGYRFEVRSSHSFTAVEGKTTRLRVLAYEKGGVTTPLEERPAIRYVEKVQAGMTDNEAAAQ